MKAKCRRVQGLRLGSLVLFSILALCYLAAGGRWCFAEGLLDVRREVKLDDFGEVKMVTEKYYRDQKEILVVQTRAIKDKRMRVDVHVMGKGPYCISYALVDGKWNGDFQVANNFPWVARFRDVNSDGSWDQVELLTDDMELVDAFRKDAQGILRPLPSKDLHDLIKQNRGGCEPKSPAQPDK